MHANIKQQIYHQFKGMYVHIICLLTLVLQIYHYILYFGTVDYLKEPQIVEYDDILALPSVQNWTKAKVFKIGYEGAELFLHF